MENNTQINSEEDIKLVSSAINNFAFSLYAQYKTESNLFFSPWSICSSLAMAYAGASGPTKTEMQATTHFPSDSSILRAGYRTLNQFLNQKDRPYSLMNANSIWIDKLYAINSGYVKDMADNYSGHVSQLDFREASGKARNIINNWIENETKKKHKKSFTPGFN